MQKINTFHVQVFFYKIFGGGALLLGPIFGPGRRGWSQMGRFLSRTESDEGTRKLSQKKCTSTAKFWCFKHKPELYYAVLSKKVVKIERKMR